MKSIIEKKISKIPTMLYLLIVLFLYTYSTEINIGAIYSRYAIVLLYFGIGIYLFYNFIVKKHNFIKNLNEFDFFIIAIVYYITFLSITYPYSFSTNINIIIMITLVYLIIKHIQNKVYYIGINELINIFELMFNTFIIFIFLSTIVAYLDMLNMFSLFQIPDITQAKRVQSWFSNSTMYGVNISLAIMFTYYNYCKNNKIINLILIFWLVYWLLMSGGRTALIILIVGFNVIILFKYKKKMLYFLLPLFLGILGSYYLLFNYLTANFLIFRRLFLYGGFGERDVKAREVFDIWEQQSVFKKIFGSGIDSLRDVYMYSAHSGFIRLWFDFGLLFLLLYCLFIIFVIKEFIIAIKRADNKVKNLLIIGLAVTCMYVFAEMMVIITISAMYDFSLFLMITALPYIYRHLNNNK